MLRRHMHSSGASTPGILVRTALGREERLVDGFTCFPVSACALVVRHVYESHLIGFTECDAEFYGDIYGITFYYCCSDVSIYQNNIIAENVLIRHLFGIAGGWQRITLESVMRNECAGHDSVRFASMYGMYVFFASAATSEGLTFAGGMMATGIVKSRGCELSVLRWLWYCAYLL